MCVSWGAIKSWLRDFLTLQGFLSLSIILYIYAAVVSLGSVLNSFPEILYNQNVIQASQIYQILLYCVAMHLFLAAICLIINKLTKKHKRIGWTSLNPGGFLDYRPILLFLLMYSLLSILYWLFIGIPDAQLCTLPQIQDSCSKGNFSPSFYIALIFGILKLFIVYKILQLFSFNPIYGILAIILVPLLLFDVFFVIFNTTPLALLSLIENLISYILQYQLLAFLFLALFVFVTNRANRPGMPKIDAYELILFFAVLLAVVIFQTQILRAVEFGHEPMEVAARQMHMRANVVLFAIVFVAHLTTCFSVSAIAAKNKLEEPLEKINGHYVGDMNLTKHISVFGYSVPTVTRLGIFLHGNKKVVVLMDNLDSITSSGLSAMYKGDDATVIGYTIISDIDKKNEIFVPLLSKVERKSWFWKIF